MNKNSDKNSKNKDSINKFTPDKPSSTNFKFRKPSGPRKLVFKIFANFKRKNLHKSPYFWFSNFFFIFLTIKMIQFALYINEFSVTLPKEEAMNYLIYLDNSQLSKMNPQVLYKYLDDLEQQKEIRKLKKNL